MSRISSYVHYGFGVMIAAVAVSASGCIIETTNDDCYCPSCPNDTDWNDNDWTGGSSGGTSSQVVLATIDTDATMETVPGEGIGVFIEVEQGGRWHVSTACDTKLSGLPCYFNVIAILPEGVTYGDVQEWSLESGDRIIKYEDGLELVTTTERDLDGMSFDVPAGEVVRFEVYLDDVADARYVYWVGGGAIHHGAPSNPIDLKPSEP